MIRVNHVTAQLTVAAVSKVPEGAPTRAVLFLGRVTRKLLQQWFTVNVIIHVPAHAKTFYSFAATHGAKPVIGYLETPCNTHENSVSTF